MSNDVDDATWKKVSLAYEVLGSAAVQAFNEVGSMAPTILGVKFDKDGTMGYGKLVPDDACERAMADGDTHAKELIGRFLDGLFNPATRDQTIKSFAMVDPPDMAVIIHEASVLYRPPEEGGLTEAEMQRARTSRVSTIAGAKDALLVSIRVGNRAWAQASIADDKGKITLQPLTRDVEAAGIILGLEMPDLQGAVVH